MRHLAERSAVFKPVFEAAQRFIDDVSTLANEVADAAPRLLPRIETLADIIKKKPISAEDNKAIARPRARPRRASFASAWWRCNWKGPQRALCKPTARFGPASGCIGAFSHDTSVRRATKSLQRRAGGRCAGYTCRAWRPSAWQSFSPMPSDLLMSHLTCAARLLVPASAAHPGCAFVIGSRR